MFKCLILIRQFFINLFKINFRRKSTNLSNALEDMESPIGQYLLSDSDDIELCYSPVSTISDKFPDAYEPII